MAGSDSQKQLLTLIRDYATEKSHGERRIVDLKKRIEQLRSELDAGTSELQDAKQFKEIAEQELRGYEVELAMNEACFQTLETRVSLIQDEIFIAGSSLEVLKNKVGTDRKFQETIAFTSPTEKHDVQETIAFTSPTEKHDVAMSVNNLENVEDTKVGRRTLEEELSCIMSQIDTVEQEYQVKLTIHTQAQLEFTGLEKRVALVKAVVRETKELQDLTSQTSKSEESCVVLGEELQRRCVCPCCQLDNMEALKGVPQANMEN